MLTSQWCKASGLGWERCSRCSLLKLISVSHSGNSALCWYEGKLQECFAILVMFTPNHPARQEKCHLFIFSNMEGLCDFFQITEDLLSWTERINSLRIQTMLISLRTWLSTPSSGEMQFQVIMLWVKLWPKKTYPWPDSFIFCRTELIRHFDAGSIHWAYIPQGKV